MPDPELPDPEIPDAEIPDPETADPEVPEVPDPGAPDAEDPRRHEPHDPTALDLARTVARSLGVAGHRRRRRSAPARLVDPQSSGARPDDRDPQLLAVTLDRLVESQGWKTDINVRTLLARWPLLVGPTNAGHSHPEAYADRVLTVRAETTAWATQLRYLAPQLLAMLNAELGQGTVTRIQVLGPDVPSWKRGRLSVRDGRGPRDTYG